MSNRAKKTVRKIETLHMGNHGTQVIVDGKDVLVSVQLVDNFDVTLEGLDGTPVDVWMKGVQDQIQGLKDNLGAHSITIFNDINWESSDMLVKYLRPMTPDELLQYKQQCERQTATQQRIRSKREAEERRRLDILLKKYPDAAVKTSATQEG